MKKIFIFLFALLIILIPTFLRMVQPGIFSTQDFHFFRLFEFDKCVQNFQIPCRWAQDAGLGYGEPLFNFYAQLPYAFGEIFHLIGFQVIDSLKIVFTLSLILSGFSMFLLANKIWKDKYAALVSSVIYVYAPYRAVDVWVRGALPEALSFIFFPLIIYFLDEAINEKGIRNKLLLGLTLGLTVLNHNLSLIMFAPFLIVWTVSKIISNNKFKVLPLLLVPIFIAITLSAFYILPVIFESKYIDLESTTRGYFDFRAHFVTIPQLLISRFWGYGGSTWGSEDGLSLSIGQVQWILPVLILGYIVIKRKVKHNKEFIFLFILGWFYLFMTHNKSAVIWEQFSFMKYIQFPWRFLSIALFSFSLASGVIVKLLSKGKLLVVSLLLVITVLVNFSFFKEDIWYNYKDSDLTSGEIWTLQRTASIGDFWPLFGHKIPDKPGNGEFINYFPGWKVTNGDKYVDATPDANGLIPYQGSKFTDTPIRMIANLISLSGLILFVVMYAFKYKFNEK